MRITFSRTVASLQQFFFSEQLLFESENSIEQPVLENRTVTLSKQLHFWWKKLFRIKISTEQLFEADTFTQQQLFQNKYFFNKGTFSKRGTSSHGDIILILLFYFYFSILSPCFSVQLLFGKSYFSRKGLFFIIYSFCRALFSKWGRTSFSWQVLFQKGYFSKQTFLEDVLLRLLSIAHFLFIS